MRALVACLAFAYASCGAYGIDSAAPPQDGGERVGSVAVAVNRQLLKSDTLPNDAILGFRVEGDYGPADWRVRPELGVQYGKDSATLGSFFQEVSVTDFFLGVVTSYSPENSTIGFRLGGGIVARLLDAEASVLGLSFSEDDTVFGIYMHGGPTLEITDNIEVGLDLRLVLAEEADFGDDFSVDASSFESAITARVKF